MEKKSLNLLSVGLKARSKTEMYWLLKVEGGLYLPSQKETTMEHISDICYKKKKVPYWSSKVVSHHYVGFPFWRRDAMQGAADCWTANWRHNLFYYLSAEWRGLSAKKIYGPSTEQRLALKIGKIVFLLRSSS